MTNCNVGEEAFVPPKRNSPFFSPDIEHDRHKFPCIKTLKLFLQRSCEF